MILIDLSPLKAGGGSQLGYNFLKAASETLANSSQYIFLIPNSGSLSNASSKYKNLKFIYSPTDSTINRIWFEQFVLKGLYRRFKIDAVFTFFGAGLPHPPNVVSIVNVAYHIICYDESPYWKYISGIEKYKKLIINFARIKRLRYANLILVETEVMKKRLCNTLKRKEHDFKVVLPAPSAFLDDVLCLEKYPVKNPSFLFLSGVAPHKNLWRLPELAEELLPYVKNFHFVISTSESDFINALNEKDKPVFFKNISLFTFLGTIPPYEISKLYQQCDFLVLLSDLESFSSNYLEAWKAGMPLIVSDRDFSRHICGNSALYIEPHQPKEAARQIGQFIQDGEAIKSNIIEGKKLFEKLPNNDVRFNEIINLINQYRNEKSVSMHI